MTDDGRWNISPVLRARCVQELARIVETTNDPRLAASAARTLAMFERINAIRRRTARRRREIAKAKVKEKPEPAPASAPEKQGIALMMAQAQWLIYFPLALKRIENVRH